MREIEMNSSPQLAPPIDEVDNHSRELPPRTGDTVTHLPSGESWLVAAVDPTGRDLVCAGWPESMAKISECEVTYRCSDEEHGKLVRHIASIRPDNRSSYSPRQSWSQWLLDQWNEAECAPLMRL